jgi:hypothetical protein
MNTRVLIIAATITLAAIALVAGCKTVVVREQAQPVYVAPAPPPPAYVVVPEPPPQIIVERRPLPPPGVVIWIDGYWHWDNGRYAWIRGHYEKPPREHVVWVAPRYERAERGYRYEPGHWGDAPGGPPSKGGPGGPPTKGGPGGPPKDR